MQILNTSYNFLQEYFTYSQALLQTAQTKVFNLAKQVEATAKELLQTTVDCKKNVVEFFNSFHHPHDESRQTLKKKRALLCSKPWSALNDAAYFQQNEALEVLLRIHGVNQKEGDPGTEEGTGDESTALHAAALSGNLDGAQILIAHGAKINATEMRGQSPLHWAARNGHTSLVHLLYAAGANIDLPDLRGKTALRLAAKRGHLETCIALITLGAQVNIQDVKGQTPYFCAMLHGHIRVAKHLFNFGADETLVTKAGKVASQVIGRANWFAFIRSFFEHKLPVVLSSANRTKLHSNLVRLPLY